MSRLITSKEYYNKKDCDDGLTSMKSDRHINATEKLETRSNLNKEMNPKLKSLKLVNASCRQKYTKRLNLSNRIIIYKTKVCVIGLHTTDAFRSCLHWRSSMPSFRLGKRFVGMGDPCKASSRCSFLFDHGWLGVVLRDAG